jgi:nucleotide-binding universal stress UspA family protein
MCLDARPSGLMAPVTPEVIDGAERRLAKLYGPGAHTMVLPGHPVTEIRRYALNHRMDLIVYGGQGLAAEKTCGERLCDDAPCSLMILFFPKRGG